MRITIPQIYEHMMAAAGTKTAIPTGFSKLDAYLDGGFYRGEVNVIGAPPGTGKSYIAAQMALHAASRGFRVAYLSLEISGEMILSRLIGQYANIRGMDLMHNRLAPPDKARAVNIYTRMGVLSDLFHIYDEVMTMNQIGNLLMTESYDMAVVDFLQMVILPGMDEYQKLTQVMTTLRNIAITRDTHILALSQLSNDVIQQNSTTERAVLQYKGSGHIAAAATLGMFLTKDEISYKLLVKKNRRGYQGKYAEFLTREPGNYFYERTDTQPTPESL